VLHANGFPALVQERDVEREAHSEGVHRSAAGEVERHAVRFFEQRQAEQPASRRARFDDRQSAASCPDRELAQAWAHCSDKGVAPARIAPLLLAVLP
jgi:hypothetical protein